VWQYQERYAEAVTAFLYNAYDSVPAEGHPTGVFYERRGLLCWGELETMRPLTGFCPCWVRIRSWHWNWFSCLYSMKC
jgi:hypothetical protein